MDELMNRSLLAVNQQGYYASVEELFCQVPAAVGPLIRRADLMLEEIERVLYKAPAFVNAVKASVPQEVLQAVFSEDQSAKFAEGALRLMTRKDGTLMANLVDVGTGQIASTLKLEYVNMTPELAGAMNNYVTQIQLAQIAEQIQSIQIAVEEVVRGQESDRLALAYSCQQKLLQAMEIRNPELKTMALLRLVGDSEDSRNLLMQSQISKLEFVKSQPEEFWSKLSKGAPQTKISSVMDSIRVSLSATNMISLVETLAYFEMGEGVAARHSLQYYAEFIQKTYLDTERLVDKLDLIDHRPENYWSRVLPDIRTKIQELPLEGELYFQSIRTPETLGQRMYQAASRIFNGHWR